MKKKSRKFLKLIAVILAIGILPVSPIALPKDSSGADTRQGYGEKAEVKTSLLADGGQSETEFSLYGNSLRLNDDIEVLFYLDIDTAATAGASVQIGLERDFDNQNKTVTTEICELKTATVGGKTYYVASYGVPAKDMAATVRVRLVRSDGSYGASYIYSAQQYIDTVLAKETGGRITAELKALTRALDVYGKNAAAVLAGGAIQETITNVVFDDVAEASGDRNDKVIRLESLSLELKSNIRLRIYFGISDETAAECFTVRINGDEVNAVKAGSYVWCIEKTVTATELNETFTFTVTSGESVFTVNLSALYYAKVMHEKADTEAEKNLMKAIKLYYDAAVAYKASLAS